MTTTKKKTKTESSLGSFWWRPRMVGAAAALMMTMAACSGTVDAKTATTVGQGPTTTTTATATTTTAPPEPAALLADALDEYAAGYEFSATVTVNDQATTVQSGRWLNGSSQLVIRSGEGEVEYVITPEGQWSRLPDGEWEELDATASTDSPLTDMAFPESLELVDSGAGITQVQAAYAAAALGLAGDPVLVDLVFTDGTLTEVSYVAEIDEVAAQSVTTLAPLSDTTPIIAPISP